MASISSTMVNQDYRFLDVKPVAGSLGAEISGVDLTNINSDIFDEIYRAFVEHQAIIFRDQNLTTDQYFEFGKRWGELAVYPYVKGLPSHPQILELLRTEEDGYAFGNVWHSDGTNYAIPPKATMLYALELPPAGGDTMFTNMFTAYETLSPGMKALLAPLKAHNAGEQKLAFSSKISMAQKDPGEFQVNTIHPVVRTHPDTGRKALYLSHRVERFDGMTKEESAPLIAFLRKHAIRPEFTCRFAWQVGSLAIWDNRSTQHYAVDDYVGHRRRMHRITIEGDEAPY